MTSLPELIAKLEAAPEGSRELDAEILTAIGGKAWPISWRQFHYGSSPGHPDDLAAIKAEKDPDRPEEWRGAFNYEDPKKAVYFEIPLYTTSIDSALTLIPAGHSTYLMLTPHMPVKAWACVAPPGLGGPQSAKKRRHLEATAAIPALALCAASMKARMG